EAAHGAQSREDLVQVLEGLEDEAIAAALQQSFGRRPVVVLGLRDADLSERLERSPQRADRAGHESVRAPDLARAASLLARLAGDRPRLLVQRVRSESYRVGSKGVGFDQLSTGCEVVAVHGLDQRRAG